MLGNTLAWITGNLVCSMIKTRFCAVAFCFSICSVICREATSFILLICIFRNALIFSWFAIGGAIDPNNESYITFELSVLFSILGIIVIFRWTFAGIRGEVIFKNWTRDIFRLITNLSIEQKVIGTELIWELMSMSTLIIGIAQSGMWNEKVLFTGNDNRKLKFLHLITG